MLRIALLSATALVVPFVSASFGQSEIAKSRSEKAKLIEVLAKELDGMPNAKTKDGPITVDVLTKDWAVVVSGTEKWSLAIGQALYLAAITERKPCIVLTPVDDDDVEHEDRCWTACRLAKVRLLSWDNTIHKTRALHEPIDREKERDKELIELRREIEHLEKLVEIHKKSGEFLAKVAVMETRKREKVEEELTKRIENLEALLRLAEMDAAEKNPAPKTKR